MQYIKHYIFISPIFKEKCISLSFHIIDLFWNPHKASILQIISDSGLGRYRISGNRTPPPPRESGDPEPDGDIPPDAGVYAHSLPPVRWSG